MIFEFIAFRPFLGYSPGKGGKFVIAQPDPD